MLGPSHQTFHLSLKATLFLAVVAMNGKQTTIV